MKEFRCPYCGKLFFKYEESPERSVLVEIRCPRNTCDSRKTQRKTIRIKL